jgi:hypothetical protein
MPHLHLPTDHSDADLVLAANVAVIVGSEDLYVAWTHHTGAGAIPEVEAVVNEHRPGAFGTLVRGFVARVRAVWHDLTQAPLPATPAASARVAPARETSS